MSHRLAPTMVALALLVAAAAASGCVGTIEQPGRTSNRAGQGGKGGTSAIATPGAGSFGGASAGKAGSGAGNGSGSGAQSGRGGNGSTSSGTAGSASGGHNAGAGTGGSGLQGTAGSIGSGGSGVLGTCTIASMATTSPKIGTVGIVTWSTSMANVSKAQIDFGLTTSYGMTAPVDLKQASYRTLLLGMKPSKMYHYRITATGSDGVDCRGEDQTIMSGSLPNGMQKPTVVTMNATALAGGFLITGQYATTGAGTSPAFILDADGDYVWAYSVAGSDATGVRMSYDGTHIWINNANVPNGGAKVHRVSMDGMTDEDLSSQFTGLSHQLTVLPDETIAFYAYGSNNCDDIKERAPDGTVKTIVNAKTAHGGNGACHVNMVQYSKQDDTLVFSDLDNNCITKVTRSGTPVWILNGGVNGIQSSFTGDMWVGGEHGINILGLDHFLIFNNNSSVAAGGGPGLGGTGDGSIGLEMKLDLTAMNATKVWSYKGQGVQNDVMGDVQRLWNGNTIVAFSTKGVIHEVDASGTLVQTITSKSNIGYIEKRQTLYGPPPR